MKFCAICGTETKEGFCKKCDAYMIQEHPFNGLLRIKGETKKNVKQKFCIHCGKELTKSLYSGKNETRGVCTVCAKPYRFEEHEEATFFLT